MGRSNIFLGLKGSNRSLSDQSEIIDTLFLLSGHAAYDNEREAWDYLIALKANSVIRANEIAKDRDVVPKLLSVLLWPLLNRKNLPPI